MKNTDPIQTNEVHRDGCTGNGFRYGATIRTNKASVANGTAGKVVMLCKDNRCSARRIV
jgi:hypothetical protein